MKRYIVILILLFIALYCYGVAIDDVILQALSKPIPVLLLMAQVKLNSKYNFLVFTGLFFSFAGDVLLLSLIDKFIWGLTAFLVAHLFYIGAFLLRDRRFRIVSMLFFYGAGGAVLYYLYPHLGELMLPVSVYVFVIISMAWRAYMQRNYSKVSIYAFMGAVIFVLSDLMLSYNKFIYTYHYATITSIIPYWTAQFLIAKSTIEKEG